jgi:hypothetical protein
VWRAWVILGKSSDYTAPSQTGRSRKTRPYRRAFSSHLSIHLGLELSEHGLVEVKQHEESTARAYCSPVKETELNLPNRSLEDIELIAKGGASGLKALGSPFIAGEGRTRVYLVDAFLAGICPQIAADHGLKAQDLLVHAGFAGKTTSANILLQVGNQVGQHFGLLENGQPNDEFKTYFLPALDHLKDQLEEAADAADTEK